MYSKQKLKSLEDLVFRIEDFANEFKTFWNDIRYFKISQITKKQIQYYFEECKFYLSLFTENRSKFSDNPEISKILLEIIGIIRVTQYFSERCYPIPKEMKNSELPLEISLEIINHPMVYLDKNKINRCYELSEQLYLLWTEIEETNNTPSKRFKFTNKVNKLISDLYKKNVSWKDIAEQLNLSFPRITSERGKFTDSTVKKHYHKNLKSE